MNKQLIVLAAALALTGPAVAATEYPFIPAPAVYNASASEYALPSKPTISLAKDFGKTMPDKVKSYFKMRGVEVGTAKKGDIRFEKDDKIAAEGYQMNITPKGIIIKAGTETGLFYAVQSLVQMLDSSSDGKLQTCQIDDSPRFEHRGLMLDPSRYFIPKEEIKKIIDVASGLKINRLHLHLADDNGWRIEIKKYPRLTEVGAWRVDREEYFPGRLNAKEGEPTPIGGYYTQDDMREIVSYAADRHITVIPEIDVPAHSAAAIASYPELMCPVTDKFVGVFPGIGGPDASIILCAGNEKVYEFYQDVLDEIMDIFPSQYIHLGGDEAEKSHWKKCPLCNKKLVEEQLPDFEALQGYFMDRLSSYVHAKGRMPMGWDEVTHGNPKEDMVILGWNGYGQAATNYAKATGRKFILTPARVLYLIRYQGPQWFEPFTYFGNVTLKDVYSFEPVKPDWTPELKSQLLGIQGSLWSEFVGNENDLEYLLFPRLVAVADNAWRQEGSTDWSAFLGALDRYTPTLDRRNVNYAQSMYNLDHKSVPTDGALNVSLECIRPDVEIRYSTTDPTLGEYAVYEQPIKADGTGKIYSATFRNGQQSGKTLTLDLNFNKATGGAVASPNCNNELAGVLTNGLRGSEKSSDFEWAGWHNRDAEFTVDLGKSTPVRSISLGCIANSHICVASPRRVSVFASADGINFDHLNTVELTDDIIYHKGAKITDIALGEFDDLQTQYIKVVAENPGVIPDGYARATAPTWMYFDEIIIN